MHENVVQQLKETALKRHTLFECSKYLHSHEHIFSNTCILRGIIDGNKGPPSEESKFRNPQSYTNNVLATIVPRILIEAKKYIVLQCR